MPYPVTVCTTESDDPALLNVHADMGLYLVLNPCECEATCECEVPDDQP